MTKVKQIIFLNLALLTFTINAQNLKLGAERTKAYIPLISNKNIAIVGNQTSMIKNTHLVDTLLSLGMKVKKVLEQ